MIGKNKQGVYFYSIYYIDSFGIRKQKKVENKEWKTKKEVKLAQDLFILSLSKPTVQDITVQHLFELHRVDSKDKIKQRSIYSHDKYYNVHIKPFFADSIVSKITRRDIVLWQDYLLKKNFTNNYLGTIQQFLKLLFNYGIKYELIQKNPFTIPFVKNHNVVQHEMMIWSVDEFNRFIEKVNDPIYCTAFKTLYWCGLRKGELFALTIRDIDFKRSLINVNKTYDHVNHITTTPKTLNSNRVVTMPKEVSQSLENLIESYNQYEGFTVDSLVFGMNKHITSTTLKRVQEQACIESGVRIIRIHDLRHSHVSLLVSMDFNPLEIAKRLGHTVEMVNNTYSHLFTNSQDKMIDKLNELQIESQKKFEKNRIIN